MSFSFLKKSVLCWFVTVVWTQTVLHFWISLFYEKWNIWRKYCLNPIPRMHVKWFVLWHMLWAINWRIHVSSCVHIVSGCLNWFVPPKRYWRLSIYNKLWLFQLIYIFNTFFWLIWKEGLWLKIIRSISNQFRVCSLRIFPLRFSFFLCIFFTEG